MLKNQWLRRRKAVYLLFFGMAAVFLLGAGVFSAVRAVNPQAQPFPMGTLLALIFLAAVHLFVCSFSIMQEFNLAVSMGVTRKSFVPGYMAFSLLELACAGLFLLLLFLVERRTVGLAAPGAFMTELFHVIARSPYILLAAFGLLAAEMLSGALTLRFGFKIYWGFWLLGMLPLFLRWFGAEQFISQTAVFIQRLDPFIQITGGLFLEFLIVLISWLLYRKQRVTFS